MQHYLSGINVSIVNNAHDTETKNATVLEILSDIRTGKWREPVEYIRTRYDQALKKGRNPKSAVRPFKVKLPGVLWSGQFSTRDEKVPLAKKFQKHSGILCADMDGMADGQFAEVLDKLQTSPFAFAIFRSPTNTGLKVLFRVRGDAASHLASFHAIQKHVRELTGRAIDEMCSDPNS